MVIICILSIYGTRVLYVLYILVSFIHSCYYFRYERFSRDKHLHNPLENCLMFAANVCERVSEWANKLLRWTEMEKSQQKGYFGEREREGSEIACLPCMFICRAIESKWLGFYSHRRPRPRVKWDRFFERE